MMARNLRYILLGLVVLLGSLLLWQELSGPEPLPPAPENQHTWSLPQLQPIQVARLSEFEPMLQRPLFSPDRKPVEVADAQPGTEDNPGEQQQQEPPQPLEVVLRGVIILPEHRIALLEDPKGKQQMRVREGEPLKGELGQWKLNKLSPRAAYFVQESTGREEEVKLQVYGKPLPATAASGKNPAANNTKQASEKNGKPAEQLTASGLSPEEIRRKVAERRARLRAEAARKRAKQKSKQE